MLKLVFLSFPAVLDIRDLIHLNLINHLLKSDLGGGKKIGPLCCQFLLMWDSSLLWLSLFQGVQVWRGKGLLAKGHLFSFYCQHNKSGWPQKERKKKNPIWADSDGSHPHGGSIRSHMRPGGPALNNFVWKPYCHFFFPMKCTMLEKRWGIYLVERHPHWIPSVCGCYVSVWMILDGNFLQLP